MTKLEAKKSSIDGTKNFIENSIKTRQEWIEIKRSVDEEIAKYKLVSDIYQDQITQLSTIIEASQATLQSIEGLEV